MQTLWEILHAHAHSRLIQNSPLLRSQTVGSAITITHHESQPQASDESDFFGLRVILSFLSPCAFAFGTDRVSEFESANIGQ